MASDTRPGQRGGHEHDGKKPHAITSLRTTHDGGLHRRSAEAASSLQTKNSLS
jgi:hypothetical protein